MGEGVRDQVVEEHRDEQRPGQGPFGDGEGHERVEPPAPCRHQRAADGDAADEGGQHQRVGVGAGPQRQGQQSRPGHFVEHGHEAGQPRGQERHPAFERGEALVGRGSGGRGRRFVGPLGAAGAQDVRHQGDAEAQARAQLHHRLEAQRRDPPPVGQQDARHRARAVDRVEGRHPSAKLREGTGHVLGQHRKRRAHEHGRQQDGEHGEAELQRQTRGALGMDRPDDRKESLADRLEIPGKDHREEPDPGLEAGVEEQRPPERIGSGSQQRIARGQSTHEGHQDRHHRVAGAAEEEGQVSCPDDLVEQPGQARDEERGQDGPEHPAGIRLHGVGRRLHRSSRKT